MNTVRQRAGAAWSKAMRRRSETERAKNNVVRAAVAHERATETWQKQDNVFNENFALSCMRKLRSTTRRYMRLTRKKS